MTRRSLTLPLCLVLAGTACDRASGTPPTAAGADDAAVAPRAAQVPTGRLHRLPIPAVANFPYYARTEVDPEGRFGYLTAEWAAIVFYRDPAQVRPDFNLFQFYDVPGAFLATPLVQGTGQFLEPQGVTPPKISQLSGGAVPIWFIRRPYFDQAIQQTPAGPVLTKAALLALPATARRLGTATQFEEVLRTIESHPQPGIAITARGTLADGGTFRYQVTWNGVSVDDPRQVSIRFQP